MRKNGDSRYDFLRNYGTVNEYEQDSCSRTWSFHIIVLISFIITILTFPISIWFSFKVVQEYERAVIFRLGKLRSEKSKRAGIIFIIPIIDTYRNVDLRTGAFNVPPQEILTKDSVTVNVGAVVYFQVSNPISAVCNNDNYIRSTKLLAATALRNILGTNTLADILSNREVIAQEMLQSLVEITEPWGVHVERIEIKDVRLPRQMQRAMAAEAEAARDATAKIIASDGEFKSSKALKEASDVIASSQAGLQLRYLQALHSISTERNSTIMFPLPMQMLAGNFKQDFVLRQRKGKCEKCFEDETESLSIKSLL